MSFTSPRNWISWIKYPQNGWPAGLGEGAWVALAAARASLYGQFCVRQWAWSSRSILQPPLIKNINTARSILVIYDTASTITNVPLTLQASRGSLLLNVTAQYLQHRITLCYNTLINCGIITDQKLPKLFITRSRLLHYKLIPIIGIQHKQITTSFSLKALNHRSGHNYNHWFSMFSFATIMHELSQ